MTRGEICARCDSFTIAGYPELAAKGEGHCSAFSEHPPRDVVAWNEPWCVLFNRARDLKRRERWITVQCEKAQARQDGNSDE
jgi:hypothetical protein